MISQSDWAQIQEFVNKLTSQIGEPFVQGVVVKSDDVRKVVWLREFGDIPIPLVAFDFEVTYAQLTSGGATVIKKTRTGNNEAEILTPKVGDMVLVAQHFGSRHLPKCLGVIQSQGYIQGGGE